MATHPSTAGELPQAEPRTPERARTDSRSNAAWLVLAALGLGAFVALTLIVDSRIPLVFDQPLLDLARSWGQWTFEWKLLSESANIPLVVIGLGMVAALFVTKRRREALVVLVVLIAVTAGSEGIKQLVARPRPLGTDPNIPGVVYSFPSGHVLEALTIFGMITVRSWRSSKPHVAKAILVIVVTVWVLLVGVARMALGEHFPSDVLAGLVGGLGVLGLYGWFTRSGGFVDHGRDRR